FMFEPAKLATNWASASGMSIDLRDGVAAWFTGVFFHGVACAAGPILRQPDMWVGGVDDEREAGRWGAISGAVDWPQVDTGSRFDNLRASSVLVRQSVRPELFVHPEIRTASAWTSEGCHSLAVKHATARSTVRG